MAVQEGKPRSDLTQQPIGLHVVDHDAAGTQDRFVVQQMLKFGTIARHSLIGVNDDGY